MNKVKTVKVAIIDMNQGVANQGVRGILEILKQYGSKHQIDFATDIFDIRLTSQAPELDYQLYISTGGPGSPFDGDGQLWEQSFFDFLDRVDDYNNTNADKKNVFLICHSFQLACKKYELGDLVSRTSTSFGIFPIYKTANSINEPLFEGLNDPFYAVDSRNWQVLNPNKENFNKMGAKLLAIEKVRANPALERCMMAIRFSENVVGTQFHPEADPVGMKQYFLREDKKRLIIKNYSDEIYTEMLEGLENPDKIKLTQSVILPNFLDAALRETKL